MGIVDVGALFGPIVAGSKACTAAGSNFRLAYQRRLIDRKSECLMRELINLLFGVSWTEGSSLSSDGRVNPCMRGVLRA